MTKYVIDLPDNVSFIVGKGYVLFNEKEFLRIPVKQLEKYSKKEDVEIEETDKDEKVVFDGRKESKMSEKYVVSQEFMDALERWKDTLDSNDYVSIRKLNALPVKINNWRWCHDNKEKNNRLIAIIRWVNGEDMFEVEKPKKWIVRSKEHNNFGEYTYVTTDDIFSLAITMGVENATCFDTKEEAESWSNSHQEVIEVEE